MPTPSNDHYQMMLDAISAGELVAFLGAGANLCGRPKGAIWKLGQYLPSGVELSKHLANEFHYPIPNESEDLLRVSQYAALMRGSGPLYKKLHAVFDVDYPTTVLHQFLANLPGLLRSKSYPPYQLVVTTNYDDLLERAFLLAGESFDLVTYEAEGDHAGKFWHRLPEGETRLIVRPNEYEALSLNKRTVILKIHGAVDRINGGKQDSFVITEDHYVNYLSHTSTENLVPMILLDKLRNSNLLFLGYSLRDWNLRVILRHIWGEQRFSWNSWAIQSQPQEMDARFWGKRGVEIFDILLDDFIREMEIRLNVLPVAGATLA